MTDSPNRHPHEQPSHPTAGAAAGVPGTAPGAGGAPAGNRGSTGGGSKKGLFGCLGCLGIGLVLLIGVPLVAGVLLWTNLDRLAAPADSDWTMVEPTEEEFQELEERVQGAEEAMETEGRASITLSEYDLNVLVARAIREHQARQEDEPRMRPEARIRIIESQILMDAMVRIPETAQGVPRPLRGAPVGMQMGLRPRVDSAGDLILGVEDVRIGRFPVPVASLTAILREMSEQEGQEMNRELDFIDPETGEIRIPASELADGEQGFRIEALEVSDGRLHLEVSRTAPAGATEEPADTDGDGDGDGEPGADAAAAGGAALLLATATVGTGGAAAA